jgi:hypothetical protein
MFSGSAKDGLCATHWMVSRTSEMNLRQATAQLNCILRHVTGYEFHKPTIAEEFWFDRWLKSLGIRTVIDVGAHVGGFTEKLLPILPSAQFYLFEPLLETACGEQDGTMEFYKCDFAQSSSMLVMTPVHKELFPHTARNTKTLVKVSTLDTILRSQPLDQVLIKLDVQGYEDRVLRGAKNVLQLTNVLVAEIQFKKFYENQATHQDLVNLLAGYGFNFSGLYHQWNAPTGEPLWGDALFVKG